MSTPDHVSWPDGFLWGAATAAAQIEGAAHEDGKTDSIWDHFARVPGAVQNGDTPERADEHYHRMPADVALMKKLGLQSYRFSTSWARIKPDDGPVNQKALDFYNRLVDELLAANILPWLTLYHWDLPQTLEDAGGWPNRDTAYRYVDYAGVVFDALGDRVSRWTTFNEPLCSSLIGYAAGDHAPGRQEPAAALAALHHQHLGHGLAVRSLRERSESATGASHGQPIQLGITLNLTNAIPHDPTDPVDVEAARRVDAIWNRAFLNPILVGSYPDDLLEDVKDYGLAEVIQPGDLETINAPIDFLGVNHYHDDSVSGHPAAEPDEREFKPTDRPTRSSLVGSEYVSFPLRGLPRTAMGWKSIPLDYAPSSCGSAESIRHCHRSTSPRTGPLMRTSSRRMARSRTPIVSRTSSSTSVPSTRQSRTAQMCAATSCGHCSTTSSGRGATASGSGSSTSTTTARNGSSRAADCGTRG